MKGFYGAKTMSLNTFFLDWKKEIFKLFYENYLSTKGETIN